MRLVIPVAVAIAAFWPLRSETVTDDNFLVRTTRDLVSLCAASRDDAHYPQAVNFCHGYVVGAYHYTSRRFPARGPSRWSARRTRRRRATRASPSS